MSLNAPYVLAQVEQPAWIAFFNRQRWFAGKAREILRVEIVAMAPISEQAQVCVLALVEVAYTAGPAEVYLLPLMIAAAATTDALPTDVVLVHVPAIVGNSVSGAVVVYDGLSELPCGAALYKLIADRLSLAATVGNASTAAIKIAGTFVGTQSSRFTKLAGTPQARQPVRASSHDQSNSAVQFGEQLFLKLFRRLETGINPDYEIAQFLTERTQFTHFPQVAGAIEYRTSAGQTMALAMLQAWVPNQGNAWEAMLADVRRVLAGGSFRDANVIRLGQHTAELHVALASRAEPAEFAPEAMTPQDVHALVTRLRHAATETFVMIKNLLGRDAAVAAVNRRALQELIDLGPAAVDRTARQVATARLAAKTRIHGDYHLGQVLCQDDDFIILDFEGEPARPLAERRAKDSPLRDVAGMLRSFGYAAHVGLIEATKPQSPSDEQLQIAAQWRNQSEHYFWQGYRTTAAGAAFLPTDEESIRTLLEFYLIEKALYEVQYGANNRPDWIHVPLAGLLELL